MPSDKPWEDYKSDSPAVLAEQAKTKKLKMKKPAPFAVKPEPPKATDAWAKAGQFTRRNEKIEEGTRRLRKAIPGQGL